MANGIGRLRTLGVASQDNYGTAANAPTFVLPLLNAGSIEPVINKIMNQAALGSAYADNAVENTIRYANLPLSVKIDENHLPLLLSQRFDITSATYTGESAVYEHVLSYTNNTNNWYTFFLEDDKRTTYIVKDALLQNFDITADQEFLRFDATVRGAYAETSTANNTVVQPVEFVGRHINFNYGDYTGAKAAYNILNATLTHNFGVSDESDSFFLGDPDIATNELTEDSYSVEVNGLEVDRTNYDDFTNNTKKKWDFTIESTDRFVTGSVANTRPYIQFDYPVGYVEQFAEDAPLDQLIKETLTLKPVDEVGVADAPLKITVRNATASY